MIACPYCNHLLLVKGLGDARLHQPKLPTRTVVTCRCNSQFLITMQTLKKGTQEEIDSVRRPAQPAETYDEQGNRKTIERKEAPVAATQSKRR